MTIYFKGFIMEPKDFIYIEHENDNSYSIRIGGIVFYQTFSLSSAIRHASELEVNITMGLRGLHSAEGDISLRSVKKTKKISRFKESGKGVETRIMSRAQVEVQ